MSAESARKIFRRSAIPLGIVASILRILLYFEQSQQAPKALSMLRSIVSPELLELIAWLLALLAVVVSLWRQGRLERRWESVNYEQARALKKLRDDLDAAVLARCQQEYAELSTSLRGESDTLKTEVRNSGEDARAAIRSFHDKYDGWIDDIKQRVATLEGRS